MNTITEQAEQFIHGAARVLERRRFAYLFRGGPVEPLLTALAAYRNDDGGYGHALEPDGRGPGSQPVHALFALMVLEDTGALDGELAAGICDHLASITADDGGLPIVHPNIREYPHAPWWGIPERYEGSLIPTANIAGLLLRNGVEHPWLARASRFCVDAIAAMSANNVMPYSALAAVKFLDASRAENWAAHEAKRLGELVREERQVQLPGADMKLPEGFAEHEYVFPHEFVPTPGGIAEDWFTADELRWSLDRLEQRQDKDGGWPLPWGVWHPAIEFEWRAALTIEALITLRAYGRLD